MGLTASGNFLIVVGGHKVYVTRVERAHEPTSRDRRGDYTKFLSPEPLTCLTMHPTEELFATGDAKGQIRLWHCLQDGVFPRPSGEKRVQTTTLHWHAHAVSSLTFTPNGAYLLSGGEEAVLVIWQIHSGKKEFVPRVGAPIQSISVSDPQGASESRAQEYLLGLNDGTLVFVKADLLKVHRTISRLKLGMSPVLLLSQKVLTGFPDFGTPSTLPPLAFHSTTQTLLLPSSHPSSLQVYSLSGSKLHSELEVSPSNRVSRPQEKPLTPAQVDLVSVSTTGDWMATIDVRDDPYNGFGMEIALKIWRWESTEGRWELNTRIERPHGPYCVRSVEFAPRSEGLLVSTGEDGTIKTWIERRVKDKTGEVDRLFTLPFRLRARIDSQLSDNSLLVQSLDIFLSHSPTPASQVQSRWWPSRCRP
jgi:NET1-associated nuclear protein 1 (U3 small nucleolar RNA-associated protein 17)